MNRNEFYKQLMSEYAFNDERIKSNAKKGRFAKQRNLPLFVGLTAAAAVCTVAVGTTIALSLGGNQGVNLIPESDGLAALSANERLQRALEEIEQNADSKELRDVLVTFTASLGSEEVRSLLTGYSESIFVKQLYFADGTKAVGSEQVGKGFDSGIGITGAVINCEGAMMKQLQNDLRVFSVEIVTESDLLIVAPINTVEAETAEAVTPVQTTTTASVTSEAVIPVESEEVFTDETTQDGEEIGEVIVDESEESFESFETFEVTLETEDTTESVSEPETAETVVEPIVPDVPVVPVVPAGKLPEGVELSVKPDKFSYESEYLGAENAFFLTDYSFYAKTADEIRLYYFDGVSEKLLASAACRDAKVVWVSENGGKMIVSGVGENDMRNQLFYINANGEMISDLHAKDTVMDGTLASTAYNGDSRLLVMNIKENGRYYVSTALVSSNGSFEFLSNCFESDSKVTLLAAYGSNVYLSVNDGGLTQVFRVGAEDGATDIIKTFETNPAFTRNLAFTHAIVSFDDHTEIFDAQTESFVRVAAAADEIVFGAAKHVFSAGGSFYSVDGTSVTETVSVSDMAKVDYRRGLSSLYTATVLGGCIKVSEGAYSNKARTEEVAFDVSENCSADIRTAAERAIGLNNAIALDRCNDCGITDIDLLNSCIYTLCSKGAAEQLKSLCGISDFGALRYDGAALTAINGADAKIVIHSQNDVTASGTLYVKAGTIGGKTAYFSQSISFACEDGVWKLACIL